MANVIKEEDFEFITTPKADIPHRESEFGVSTTNVCKVQA